MRARIPTIVAALLTLASPRPAPSAQPQPPQPFAVSITVRRPPLPPPPAPFAVRVEVSRREPPPAPAPFAIRVTVARPSLPTGPAPFPVRVTVHRADLPAPPSPAEVRVSVRRAPLPPAPAPFAIQVSVARRGQPPLPEPFPVRVAVARQPLPPPPAPAPVRVSVRRPEPPPPPPPFPVRVTVARPDPSEEVADLLAELRRMEAESAEEEDWVHSAVNDVERDLAGLEGDLRAAEARLRLARAAADGAEPARQRVLEAVERILLVERTASRTLPTILAAASEVCAAESGGTPLTAASAAALAPKVDAADAAADDLASARVECERLLAEAEAAEAEWTAAWQAAEPQDEAELDDIASGLAATTDGPLADLARSTGRLTDLDGEAAPVLTQVEERAATWTDPGIDSLRQEVTQEARELAGKIASRARRALDAHERLRGEIEDRENRLALLRTDLADLRERARNAQSSVGVDLATRLAEARRACERAREIAADAADAVTDASGCLERATEGTESTPEGDRVSVPDLRGKSEDLAVAWLSDLHLVPVVVDGSRTPPGSKQNSVEAQEPTVGHQILAGASVTLRVFRGAPSAEPGPAPESQKSCSELWTGTVLTTRTDGSLACACPSGSAWSKVQERCLSLSADGSPLVPAASCSHRPGTMRDSVTGECRCPVGEWSTSAGRCVDRAAEDRERRIGDLEKGAGCERLYADLEVFSSHPEPLYRQMAASARQQASAMGCDPARIEAAVAASTRFGTPTGGTSGGGSTGGAPAGPGSSGETTGSATGALCVLTDIDYSHVGSGPTAYLVYRNPSTSPGRVPDAYGVLGVPTRIKSGDRVTCTGARACLAQVAPSAPFQILREYSDRSAASAEARRHCPNPVHTSTY